MDRHGACHFCGTDERLRSVSVTPRARRDDPDASVTLTLCRSCERKLERLLGRIFDHVESRPADGPDVVDRSDEPAADDDRDDHPEPERVDRIDGPSGSDSTDSPPHGRRRLFSPPEASAGEDGPSASTAEGPTDDERGDEDAEIIDDEPRVHARATATPNERLEGVSVDEYNRVMRLLQNRTFPMGRVAFVDLAANAYDLGEEAVEAVLDTVIEQGMLAEQDGSLVKPGEGSP